MTCNAHSYDTIVAGGGLSGLISAQRLASSGSFSKIALCEAETKWGGRMSTFLGMSPQLFEFLLRSFGLAQAELATIQENDIHLHTSWSQYASGKWTHLELAEIFSSIGFKALGGAAAQKAWEELSHSLSLSSSPEIEQENLTPLMKLVGKFAKKNPAFLVLEQLSKPLGIPNLMDIHSGCLKERILEFTKGQVVLPWQKIFETLIQSEAISAKVDPMSGCRILSARYSEAGLWEIETERGLLTAPKLLVAMPPWQALEWLPKELIPLSVLNLCLKSKPVSLVTLSKKLLSPMDQEAPSYGLIASEDASLTRTPEALYFQEAVDFEHSLDAPSVTKAIKRMRRAAKKFQDACPQAHLSGEYLSLKPVAWPSPMSAGSAKIVKALGEYPQYQKPHLAFAGDAYGSSYQLDENLRHSVLKATEVFCESLGDHQTLPHRPLQIHTTEEILHDAH